MKNSLRIKACETPDFKKGRKNGQEQAENVERKSRKRKRNVIGWKRNIRKNKRNNGEEYINAKNKLVSKRKLKTPCNEKCRYKCYNVFSEEEREGILKTFWETGDNTRQRQYISINIENIVNPKYRYPKENMNRIPVIRLAKKNGKPYIVHKLDMSDVYDLEQLSEDLANSFVLNFRKDAPYSMYYKHNYDDVEYHEIDIRGRKSSWSCTTNSLVLKGVYKDPPKISQTKKDGLLYLCRIHVCLNQLPINNKFAMSREREHGKRPNFLMDSSTSKFFEFTTQNPWNNHDTFTGAPSTSSQVVEVLPHPAGVSAYETKRKRQNRKQQQEFSNKDDGTTCHSQYFLSHLIGQQSLRP
ncbi:hypothetical protein ILUMI_22783 [Ignelater luminosus]|uniref:Uncharacterized protein n=1 Tax=Ignelater luminosus TaxID=2038154 RepID=A0A8K0FX91_IGNLU|nr:hypothetical protein ILUMI_22783 [Ignelater luminosus]